MSKALQNIVMATVVAGGLDISAAIIYWGQKGVACTKIGQTIYSSLVGKVAFDGGVQAAAFGFGMHFGIMLVMAIGLYLILKIIPDLKSVWLLSGAVYGLGLWAMMNYLILPKSKMAMDSMAVWPPKMVEATYFSLFGYVVLVGVVMAFFLKGDGKKSY